MASQIHIIGLGVAEEANLDNRAAKAFAECEVVCGWERHRAIVEPLLSASQQFIEVKKLHELKKQLEDSTVSHIAVIASGDPLFYGIGRWLAKQFAAEALSFYPAVSSIQAACHKQGLSLQDVHVVSLHGRPLNHLRSQLKANRILVILSDDMSQPQHLAQECLAANFEESIITVHERLGYEDERTNRFSLEKLDANDIEFNPLHVSVIEVRGRGGVLPEFPGIPDEHFETGTVPGKGMISKREVRLAILSLMQTNAEDIVWDIGAGCGGVAIELAHWNPDAKVYAIEFDKQRLNYLTENRCRFGVEKNLTIIAGRAPEALKSLPKPSKVFIGGSDGELKDLLQLVWEYLPQHGVLAASAVIDSTKAQLSAFSESLSDGDVESVEIGVKRGSLVEGKLSYVAKLPVEIFKFTKH